MRFFTARRLALAALVPALVLLSVIPGCSQQGEGDRCGDSFGAADSNDCGSGLTCTPYSALLNGASDKANRCCYPNVKPTDSRCTLAGASSAAGSGGGSSMEAAGANSVAAEAGAGGG